MVEIVRHSKRAPAFGIIQLRDHLNRMFLEQLHREDYRHRTAIDIGTGTGRVVWELAPRAARVIGVDKEERWLMDARAYAGIRGFGRVTFVRGDAETTAWSVWHPEPFDFVTAHLCMSAAIIFRASRHLRAGGKIILGAHHKDQWREKGRGPGPAVTGGGNRGRPLGNGVGIGVPRGGTTVGEGRGLLGA